MNSNVSLDTCLAQAVAAHEALGVIIKTLQFGDVMTGLPLFPVSEDTTKLETIRFIVGQYYGFSVRQLCSSDRHAELAWARHVAMFMAREFTKLSTPKLGIEFGNRDHATVLHAVKTVTDRSSIDKTAAHEIQILGDILRKRFGSGEDFVPVPHPK